MKVEVAVLGSTSRISNSPYGLSGRTATLNLNLGLVRAVSCVKVEVDVLGFPSLVVLMVSVDVKQH